MRKLKISSIIGLILSILATASVGYAIYSVYILKGIETFYRIMGCTLLVLFLITVVYTLIESAKNNRKVRYIISIILSVLLMAISIAIAIVIQIVYSKLKRMTNTSTELTYKTILISLEDKGDISSLSDLKIGLLENEEDITGHILPLEVIESNNLKDKNTIKEISDTITLMNMLLNKELDAIFISANYKDMFKKIDSYNEETTSFVEITTYSKVYEKKEIEPEEVESSEITKPFTILLLGVDSTEEILDPNDSFNGDTIMLIAVDPATLHVTMFSIPRDTYVTMGCGGNITKINAASWGGTTCMVKTVEKLTGIGIDYYVNVNFKGVVNLVDALGGITIDVPMTFCETDSNRWGGDGHTICLNEGVQTLNGEEALAVARHRKTLATGDFQRGQNQQVVVEGMFNSLKNLRSVTDFYNILDTVSKNIETNMTTDEMLSLYKFLRETLVKSGDIKPNITKTYLTGYSLMDWTGYYLTYTFQYYRHSLNDIVNALKINLGLIEQPIVKSASFCINTPYEAELIGNTWEREATKAKMIDLIGYSVEDATAWAQSNGLVVSTEYLPAPCEGYFDDEVISQSIHEDVLLERVSRYLTLGLAKIDHSTCTAPSTDTTTDEGDDNPTDTGSGDNTGTNDNQTTEPTPTPDPTPEPDPEPSNDTEDNNDNE